MGELSSNESLVDPARNWHPARCIGFRILLIYFLIYTFPFPLDYLPWVDKVAEPLSFGRAWEPIAPWVAKNILGIEGELFLAETGSGDTTFDYVTLFMIAIVAISVTTVWSLLDRNPRNYDRLAQWLAFGCCFYLGTTLLAYGFVKVIPSQFRPPTLTRLLQPVGDVPPMGLVWTFMGASTGYTIFTGLGELVAGMLLFFRHTRTLGAFVTIAVMTNVVMLNFCYDVPVKLLSTHMLTMGVAILLCDARRLGALFLFNRPASSANLSPLISWHWARIPGNVVRLGFIGWLVFHNVDRSLEAYYSFGVGRQLPPLWGIHDVKSFVENGEALPPLLTDQSRWRGLIIDHALPFKFDEFERPGHVSIWHMDGSFKRHDVEIDTTLRTITFISSNKNDEQRTNATKQTVFRYKCPQPGELILNGTWQDRELEIHLEERDLNKMLLLGRGFHWINERPLMQ